MLQPSRLRDAMDSAGLLVLRPGASRDVATDDDLEREDSVLPDKHGATADQAGAPQE